MDQFVPPIEYPCYRVCPAATLGIKNRHLGQVALDIDVLSEVVLRKADGAEDKRRAFGARVFIVDSKNRSLFRLVRVFRTIRETDGSEYRNKSEQAPVFTI